jgi:transcriptional regulator with XRE-family HTH domain
MDIHQQIRAAREAKGLTPTELGAAVGASAAAVSTWETGRRVPTRDLMFRVCRVLDLDPRLFDTTEPEAVPAASGGLAEGGQR